MYTRALALPTRSFFLFGPRGTGKSTWLREVLPGAQHVNLLSERDLVTLARQPSLLGDRVRALPPGSWVVIDEVQRLPSVLDEVHELLTGPGGYRFALTGSSARKLRREEVNLLAGRALERRMFPLTWRELGRDFRLERVLETGTLPLVFTESDGATRRELLEAYVSTYLTQEVRHEALVKRLEPFVRFLEVTAGLNGQLLNLSAIARESAVARPTVQGYLDVLTDTLIAHLLPAWRPRFKVKEMGHPKLYLFDTGVVRSLQRRGHDAVSEEERGRLLETYVLHELRAHSSYASVGGELCHWGTPSGGEVDFVWTRTGTSVGIEVKASARWRGEYTKALEAMLDAGLIQRGFVAYLGKDVVRVGRVTGLPLERFLEELAEGRVLG